MIPTLISEVCFQISDGRAASHDKRRRGVFDVLFEKNQIDFYEPYLVDVDWLSERAAGTRVSAVIVVKHRRGSVGHAGLHWRDLFCGEIVYEGVAGRNSDSFV